MSQNSTAQLIKEQLSKEQTFLVPKLEPFLYEKTKAVIKTLSFKGFDPVKADRAAYDIAHTASLDVMDNIGRINDFSASYSVIADSITQSLLAHPLTHTQAMHMNEPKMYSTAIKIIGDPAKILPGSNLENVIVLSNLENLTVFERPTIELQAKITEEVDRHVQEKSPLAHPDVNNTLKENALEMVNTYTENLNNKTKILLEKGEIPNLDELNKLKTETFNVAATKITTNTSTFKDKVEPEELAERLSYVLDLKPLDQNQTETLGLGTAEPGILTFTKGAGASGFTVGFGIANNQSAQVGAYNSLLVYDKDWLEKTSSRQVKIIEATKEKANATPREIINANYAQKKLDVLQNARVYQSQNPKMVEAYQEYFQSRPAGSRLYVSSQAAQNTTTANFNEYRGAYTPRSLSTNTGSLAQRTFGGLAFKFGGSKLGSLSKITKLGKVLASEATLPLMIKSATQKLMKIMAVGTGIVFGAFLAYFMKLGAAALKGFLIGAAIGAPIGALGGAALGLAIAAPFGPFAPFVAAFTVPAGAVIGGFVGGTIGGIAGGAIGYGLASGSMTAVSTGIGVGIGGTIGTIVGASLGAAAVAWIPVIGPFLAPVGAIVGATVGAYVGAAVGGAVGYAFGHYVLGTIGAPLTGAATGAVIGFYVAGPPGAIIGAGIGYLAGGGWHQVGDFLAGSGAATGGAISSIGGFFTGAASTISGWISGATGGFLSGAGHIASVLWNGMTSFTASTSAIATPVLAGIGSVAIVGTVSGIITSTSFFNNALDTSNRIIPSQSQYLTIVKTASPVRIDNSNLPADINFNVTVTAHTSTLINVVCKDTTVLIRTDGTTRPLTTDLPIPICPTTINPNQVLTFNFKTHTDNTPEFQNSTITNEFDATFDAQNPPSGTPPPSGSACSAGDGFGAGFLPQPIPQSAGSVTRGQTVPPEIVSAAANASQQTGTPCEMMIGMDYVEAGWDPNSSFVTGATLGSPELNSIDPDLCTATGGTVSGNSCIFYDLNTSALFQANFIQWKMQLLTGQLRSPQNFDEMIGAMSLYNGGGNSNCGSGVPYSSPCPPPTGIDDPYSMAHFDSIHADMFLIYCADGTRCSTTTRFSRDGAATAAKEYYLSVGGN